MSLINRIIISKVIYVKNNLYYFIIRISDAISILYKLY